MGQLPRRERPEAFGEVMVLHTSSSLITEQAGREEEL
jgi:hypothetical protein